MRISKGQSGVSITLGDGLHLQVKTMQPGPHRRPLRHRHPLEQACPQLEAPALVSKVLTFTVQDTLCLRQGLVSRAHDLTPGGCA
jgi:hypothetical protein